MNNGILTNEEYNSLYEAVNNLITSVSLQSYHNNFQNIIQKENTILESIKRILNRNLNDKYITKIEIVKNNSNNYYGPIFYPMEKKDFTGSISGIDFDTMEDSFETVLIKYSKIFNEIINNNLLESEFLHLWSKQHFWILELDSMMFTDVNLLLNAHDIIAAITDKLLSTVLSANIPLHIYDLAAYTKFNLNTKTKELIKIPKLCDISYFLILDACSYKNYFTFREENELIPDYMTFIRNGNFISNYNTYINKIMKTYNNRDFDKPEHEVKKEFSITLKWVLENINELSLNTKKLKHTLQIMLLKNHSSTLKNFFSYLQKQFMWEDMQNFNDVIKENYIVQQFSEEQKLKKLYNKALEKEKNDFNSLLEAFGKVKTVDQSNIDMITLEVEGIETKDDKIYVLGNIYELLDIIEMNLELIEKGKKQKVKNTPEKLIQHRKQLEDLKEKAMKASTKSKKYGIFVKYPRGYEG